MLTPTDGWAVTPTGNQSPHRKKRPVDSRNLLAIQRHAELSFSEPRRPSATSVAWIALPAQMVICGAVLFVVGLFQVFAEGGYDGLNSMVGIAIIAAVVTIPALIIGLPLRFIPPLRRWWFRSGTISLLVIAAGALLLVISFHAGSASTQSYRPEPHVPAVVGHFPDPSICIIGWVTLALGLAHVWFPRFFPRLVPWPLKGLVPARGRNDSSEEAQHSR
jgi:hypothetical protein